MSELHQRDACGAAVVASFATTGVWPARMPICKDGLQVHRGFNGARRAAVLEKAEPEPREEFDAKATGKKP